MWRHPCTRSPTRLSSSQTLRIGEALAIEDSPRCLAFEEGKLQVVQQLCYNNAKFAGFFLKEPKAGLRARSTSTPMVAVQNHISTFGSTEVKLVDATDASNVHRRVAKLIIVDRHGRPLHDTSWSEYWIPRAQGAGWLADEGGTFHALRHFARP